MIFIDFSKTNKYKILLLLFLIFSLSILLFACTDSQFYTLDVEITPDEDKGEVIIENKKNHYNQNDTVKLEIESKDGNWSFHKWQGDLDSFNYEEEIVIQENTNIIANFSDDLVELQVSPENDFEDLKANGNGGKINGEEVEEMSIKGDFNDNQVGDLKYNLDWNEEENKWIGRYDLNNSDLSREDDFRYDVNNGENDLPKEGKLNIGEEDVLNKGNDELKQVTFDFDNWIETVKEGEKGEILEDDIESLALVGEFNNWEKDNLDYALDYRDDYLWQEEFDLEEGEEFRFSFNEGEYILPSFEDEQELNTGHEDNLKIGYKDDRGNNEENENEENDLKRIVFDLEDWDEVSKNGDCGEIKGEDIENITLKGDFNGWDAKNSDYPLECLEGEEVWEGEFDLGIEEEFRYSINDGEFILPKNNDDSEDEEDNLKVGEEKEKEYIEFKCDNLKDLVYETLDKNRDKNIYPEDVEHVSNLDYSSEGIEYIKALQYFESLRKLNLNFNDIKDISHLKELYNLESLYLNRNDINDLGFLSDLTNLRILYAHQNNIEDISFVNNLSQLEHLSLWNNEIKDISHLSNLNNIEELNLQNNNIREIKSLKTLDNLEKLEIHRNNLNKAKFEFSPKDWEEVAFNENGGETKEGEDIKEVFIKIKEEDFSFLDEEDKPEHELNWNYDEKVWVGEFYLEVNSSSIQNFKKVDDINLDDEFQYNINNEKSLPEEKDLIVSEENILDNNIFIDNKEDIKKLKDRGVKVSY